MKINCDIGERGIENKTDIELMRYIDIANIACGGHSGNSESVNFYSELAKSNGVKITAHLSYPDKINFGRVSINIHPTKLLNSLDKQIKLFPKIDFIKFHGALYNDSCKNKNLSTLLSTWCVKNNIKNVLTQENSELAIQCEKEKIKIIKETFAERRYEFNENTKSLYLRSRKKKDALIENVDEAIEQFVEIYKNNRVKAFNNKTDIQSFINLDSNSICIHSDSKIALKLAENIRKILDNDRKTI